MKLKEAVIAVKIGCVSKEKLIQGKKIEFHEAERRIDTLDRAEP